MTIFLVVFGKDHSLRLYIVAVTLYTICKAKDCDYKTEVLSDHENYWHCHYSYLSAKTVQ